MNTVCTCVYPCLYICVCLYVCLSVWCMEHWRSPLWRWLQSNNLFISSVHVSILVVVAMGCPVGLCWIGLDWYILLVGWATGQRLSVTLYVCVCAVSVRINVPCINTSRYIYVYVCMYVCMNEWNCKWYLTFAWSLSPVLQWRCCIIDFAISKLSFNIVWPVRWSW